MLKNKNEKVYIAGHSGLVGSAVLKKLKFMGCENVIVQTHKELDLTRQLDVERFFQKKKPDYVILAAAKVGGIHANINYSAEFIYKNVLIQTNVIHSAFVSNVKKLLYFGSACSYPRECPQPMKEEYLLTGVLEKTNEPYAIAKISGLKMCEAYNRQYGTNFICAILANTYGPNDNFDPENSHVIPSLIKKFHFAKTGHQELVEIWGTGNVKREFIYADDVADASVFLLKNYNESTPVNVGIGEEITINGLANLIKDVVRYNGQVCFDSSKPDGVLRKTLDNAKIRELGWKQNTSLKDGIQQTYEWFQENYQDIKD